LHTSRTAVANCSSDCNFGLDSDAPLGFGKCHVCICMSAVSGETFDCKILPDGTHHAEGLVDPNFDIHKKTLLVLDTPEQPTTTTRILSFGGFDGCTQGGANAAKRLKST
jgi:hypothetical protein